jgi:hypothetical protein
VLLCFLCVSKKLVFSVPLRPRGRCSGDRLQHVRRRGVVAKRLTNVDEEVLIPGRKHKAAAQL